MSEKQGDQTSATAHDAANPPTASASTTPLTDLMADGARAAGEARGKAPGKAGPDLEAEALRAAEAALNEGQKTLQTARTELRAEVDRSGRRSRELLLRGLLAVNVLAMLAVALLPSPSSQVPAVVPPPAVPEVQPQQAAVPQFNDPWNRALAAAESREFGEAITILEQYLADSPRMAPSQKLSVLSTLAYYASRTGNVTASAEYQRRAEAVEQSHSLPEDLVAMAKEAAASGDQESLRRVWARFLLQQRQVPSWLYKHVAEAYLQLGDSYRQQANTAAEQARLRELEEIAARVRGQGGGKEAGK